MADDLNGTVHLPSGAIVHLSRAALTRARAAAVPGSVGASPGPFAQALALLSAEGVLSTESGGAPLDVYTLPIRDVHTLRALLTRAAHLPEEPAGFTCENCGASFETAPTSHLETGPFVDGELGDPELDAPFPFGAPQPIPRVLLPTVAPRPSGRRPTSLPPVSRPSGARSDTRAADTITFAERTADDARALFRAADAWLTGRSRAMRITPAIVLGMGIVALGTERRTSVLAQALASASGAAWSRVVDLWLDAAYPRRLFGLYRCPECGARNDLDVPLAREWDREASRARARSNPRDAFPDLDTFEQRVRAHADRIYAARGVRNIDLFVDAGVPACDDGGEPLLGSYLPGGTDETTFVPRSPEVRLYYRTFKSEYAADPTFDVEAEIAETIDHEIEHHLNHLGGEDPLDDEERAAIDKEDLRRIGAREAARRTRRALTADLTGFFRATWLLWVAMTIAALILWGSRQ